MVSFLKSFRTADDGAVTVDWVMLVAATIALGLIVLTAVKPAAVKKTQNIIATIETPN